MTTVAYDSSSSVKTPNTFTLPVLPQAISFPTKLSNNNVTCNVPGTAFLLEPGTWNIEYSMTLNFPTIPTTNNVGTNVRWNLQVDNKTWNSVQLNNSYNTALAGILSVLDTTLNTFVTATQTALTAISNALAATLDGFVTSSVTNQLLLFANYLAPFLNNSIGVLGLTPAQISFLIGSVPGTTSAITTFPQLVGYILTPLTTSSSTLTALFNALVASPTAAISVLLSTLATIPPVLTTLLNLIATLPPVQQIVSQDNIVVMSSDPIAVALFVSASSPGVTATDATINFVQIAGIQKTEIDCCCDDRA